MNCQRAQEYFSELLDPRRDAPNAGGSESADFAAAREHLAHCPDCQREFASLSQTLLALDELPIAPTSPELRSRFHAMLEAEQRALTTVGERAPAQQRRFGAAMWRWFLVPLATCALLAIGFSAGTRYGPAPVQPPLAAVDPDTRQELQELRSKIERLETMNQLVAAALQQQQRPAGERLRSVLTSAAHDNPTDLMINELIASLALDSSTNVRLRALEALYPHANREVVRASVVASLPRESNPLVQVAMIDFLAAARDAEAKPALEKMLANELTDQSVREAARHALAQL